MTSNFDMSQYLSMFLDEADEQIQLMDENILLLEKNRDDLEILNTIFRAAHTIKGSSASMGFEKMAEITHSLENILDLLRHDQLEVTTEIIDLLLDGLDKMKELKDDIVDDKDSQVDITPIIERLKNVMNATENIASLSKDQTAQGDTWEAIIKFNDIEENLIRTAEIKGYKAWQISISLDPECLMKAARAYIVYNNLKDLGEIIKTEPTIEDIEAENFDLELHMVIVTTEDKDHIENSVKYINEIDKVVVKKIDLSNDVELTQEVIANDAQGETAATASPLEKQTNPTQERQGTVRTTQTVRVDVQRLENLMNLAGELVIDRIRLTDVEETLRNKYGSEDLLEVLEEISLHIGRITGDLQEQIMKARMLPIEQVFNRFPRMIRDLAQKAGKEVDFIVEGRETELDRTVIEEIGDPLIHLLRNAIDHGIEPPDVRQQAGKPSKGTVKLRASHQENQIVITIEDDGKGINTEKIVQKAIVNGIITEEKAERISPKEAINLMFAPGISTAESVSNVSGRGVGMDIVRNHIEKINGLVDIDTKVGEGTKFTIRLPLTLAITRSLLIKFAQQIYAIPLANVVEIVNIPIGEIKTVSKQQVAVVRGDVLPLYSLSNLLEIKGEVTSTDEEYSVVVVGISDKRVGIMVDDLIGEQEVVIKSLGDYLGKIPGIAGATIMGDGSVTLILDVRGLMEGARLDK